MKNNSFKRQAGYTMVELSIGVTVVALVLAGVVSAGRKLSQDVAFNEFVQEIETGIPALKALTRREASTWGVITGSVAMTGVFKNLEYANDYLNHRPTGIRLQFDRNAVFTGQGYGYHTMIQAAFSGYDRGQCLNLLSSLQDNAAYVGTWGNNSLTTLKNKNSTNSKGYVLSEAADACAKDPIVIYILYDRV